MSTETKNYSSEEVEKNAIFPRGPENSAYA